MATTPAPPGDGAMSEREQRYARVLAWVCDELRSTLDDEPDPRVWWPVAARVVGVLEDLLEQSGAGVRPQTAAADSGDPAPSA